MLSTLPFVYCIILIQCFVFLSTSLSTSQRPPPRPGEVLLKSQPLRSSCPGISLFKFKYSFSQCFHCAFLRGTCVTDERPKEGEGEIKRGGAITCNCICCSELILNCDGRRHLSQAVNVPMNHALLGPSSLSLSTDLSPGGTQPVSLRLCLSLFVAPLSHVPVSEYYQRHGMRRGEMKCICSLFSHFHPLPATCSFISRCVFTPGFSRADPAVLLCGRTNRLSIRLATRNRTPLVQRVLC